MKVYRAVIDAMAKHEDPWVALEALFFDKVSAQEALAKEMAKLGEDWEIYGEAHLLYTPKAEYHAFVNVDFVYDNLNHFEAETARRRSEALARLTGGKS